MVEVNVTRIQDSGSRSLYNVVHKELLMIIG